MSTSATRSSNWNTRAMPRAAFFALILASARAFSPARGPLSPSVDARPTSSLPTTTNLRQSSQPNEMFDSPGWPAIESELDQVPIFAVANAEGNPIKYKIEKGESSFDVPLFYTHVEDALKELEKAKETTPTPGMDINPYPLGGIFRMWATNEAVIVPNKRSIIMAGAPPSANPMGQQVPLFACMEIAQENEKGQPVLPLFFELEDAQAAVKQAVSADGGKEEDFEVVGLNLPQAVSLLANAKEEATAFQFVPPKSSIEHIRDYLSG